MSDAGPTPRRPAALLIGAALTVAAVLYGGYDLWIGLAADDSENLETSLALVAARQFTDGPGSLYGPFDGEHPSVLIQAPFYYRLTGLLAWPLVTAGVGPLAACVVAGRLISAVSFAAALVLARRLATLDGAPARSGTWAMLLLIGTPLIGGFPVTVRADMLGVCLQTVGMVATLAALRDGTAAPARRLAFAYAAFGLALCVKQHYVAGPALASLLLAVAALRGRVRVGPLVAAHAVGLAVVALVYGAELTWTSGMLLRSAFVVPGRLRSVSGGSWAFVGLVGTTTLKRGIGLAIAGAGCLLAASRRSRGGRLDAVLGLWVALELALMVKLCLNSSGGWTNYALQATLCGSVLLGRSLARVVAAEADGRRLAVAALACLLLAATVGRTVAIGVTARLAFRRELAALLRSPGLAGRDRDQVYFAGPLQPVNTRAGRADLAHDEWLYGAFEAVRAAEPREVWLRTALADGPVRVVVAPSGAGTVAGLGEPLTDLGYRRVAMAGEFAVWERR